jgi:hypothetical protein
MKLKASSTIALAAALGLGTAMIASPALAQQQTAPGQQQTTPTPGAPGQPGQATPGQATPGTPGDTMPREQQSYPGQSYPGQHTPPGQDRTPPGQDRTPPGQDRTPPGQAQTPPGQATPPGQEWTPPGQAQTPPGQAQTPPGQQSAQISDVKLDQFVDALSEIHIIRQTTAVELEAAADTEEAQRVQQEAQERMVEVVEESGLTVEEYNNIATMMSSNPELASRVHEKLEDRS